MLFKFFLIFGNDGEIFEQVIIMKEFNSCEKILKEKSEES